jgi:hypothetical protein
MYVLPLASKRIMLTLSRFQEIYSRFQSSGLRVRDFCANEGLHESKFYYWQKKLHSTSSSNGRNFIPIVFDPSGNTPFPRTDSRATALSSALGTSPSACYPCEIVYPGGTILRLSSPTDVELLRQLLLLNP